MYRKRSGLWCIILVLCMTIGVSGCADRNPGGNSSNTAAGVSDHSQTDSAENAESTAIKKEVNMDSYGLMYRNDHAGIAYSIDGNIYLSINDVASLSKTEIAYDEKDQEVTFGDSSHPSAGFYMPNLSAYPYFGYSSEDTVIDHLANIHWKADGIIDLTCVTTGMPFHDATAEINKKLKLDGFNAATEKQYTELSNKFSEFKKGELKNTYIKYGSEKEEYALQLLDGGQDKNKAPLMIVRIKGEPGYPKKNWTENPSDTVTGASEADSGQKGESTAALKTTVTVKYYDLAADISAYKIDGNLYMSMDDISRLFRTRMIYDPANRSVSFGDATRACPAAGMSYDLAEYPNPENLIGSLPSEIWSEDGAAVSFKFTAQDNSFQNVRKKFDEKLKSEGFSIATEKQYSGIPATAYTDAFQHGEIGNTYFKSNRMQYGNGELSSDTFQSVIQLVDGGLDENNHPVITVILLSGPYER